MLRALGVDIIALKERYPADTKDLVFLRDFKNGDIDVFISNNTAQRTNPIEATLLKEANVTSIYFRPFWSKLVFWEQAKWLIWRWPMIDGFVGGVAKGTCADVQQNGRATVYPL